ncbi:MAG: hypothetical protein GY953_18765, partial [bacterium]|nr:hypothetical protein [bacterium]
MLACCSGPRPQAVIREIASGLDHNHVTTRQFQHMVFQHERIWFVFYSDGQDFRYQTSSDSGATWAPAESPVAPAPNGSTSFDVLKTADTVYIGYTHYPLGRYDVNAPYAKDPARRGEFTSEGRIRTGQIEGNTIRWVAGRDPGFTLDYTHLLRDSGGYLSAFTRSNQVGTAFRSRRPDSIDDWLPATECISIQGRHAMDASPLNDGKLYAASALTTEGKLYGNLYDGADWGAEPTLIADDMTTVAGDDRRLAVDFDPTERRLHLIHVDASSTLRYRSLDAPYRPEDWQPPLSSKGLNLGEGIFTAALSVDTSITPYDLVVTYGLQRHAGSDARVLTG